MPTAESSMTTGAFLDDFFTSCKVSSEQFRKSYNGGELLKVSIALRRVGGGVVAECGVAMATERRLLLLLLIFSCCLRVEEDYSASEKD